MSISKLMGTDISSLAKAWGTNVSSLSKIMGTALDVAIPTPVAGTPTVFESASAVYVSVTMMDSTHAIVCYRDGGNSNYGTACCLTLSGTDITAGTPTVFLGSQSDYISVTMMDSTHAIVCCRDGSTYGVARCLTLSGTDITAGAPFELYVQTDYVSVTAMDSTHAIVCYRDVGNNDYGTACCLTLSGTTITAGTPAVFESAITSYVSVTVMDSTHAIVCYRDDGNSNYGTACCLTLSGTDITAGTPTVFENDQADYISVTAMDSTHAIVCYRDGGNSSYGTACCLTLSGTDITAGTPAVFESAHTTSPSIAMIDSTHAIVCYRDTGNSDYGTACCLVLSGATITAGTPAIYASTSTNYTSVVMLDSTHAIVGYRDNGNSGYGTACCLTIA